DLFVAGIDTTSSTVEWIMAELLRNPDKLAKLRKEFFQEIGKDVKLEEPHILKLSFLQAVVKETLCLHPPGLFLAPHKCDEMISISDFMVPKNAQLLVNVCAIGRDPTIWENPNMFMPERFLKYDIDFKVMDYQAVLLLIITFVSASILIFIRRLFNQTSESTKLPPGPRPFSIIGNILELGTNTHRALTKLSRIYGTFMTLKLGSITTIVISSLQVAK
ncbi:Cytochrome P450 76AD1, partial [Mucuna pruriens]